MMGAQLWTPGQLSLLGSVLEPTSRSRQARLLWEQPLRKHLGDLAVGLFHWLCSPQQLGSWSFPEDDVGATLGWDFPQSTSAA